MTEQKQPKVLEPVDQLERTLVPIGGDHYVLKTFLDLTDEDFEKLEQLRQESKALQEELAGSAGDEDVAEKVMDKLRVNIHKHLTIAFYDKVPPNVLKKQMSWGQKLQVIEHFKGVGIELAEAQE